MKLNIGCGVNKHDGYINIDKYAECEPDMQMDAEVFPWAFKDNEIDEVVFNHSLEHMGADTEVFLGIIKELYRVCKPGAKVVINVPHPRHDNFINDPTHVRIITPALLSLFSKKLNDHWKKNRDANTPLALYLGVDFEVKSIETGLEGKYIDMLRNGEVTNEEMHILTTERNNVALDYNITLEVIK